MDKVKYVEYLSEEWNSYTMCTGNYATGKYGWITWEIFEIDGVKIAKMVWSRL